MRLRSAALALVLVAAIAGWRLMRSPTPGSLALEARGEGDSEGASRAHERAGATDPVRLASPGSAPSSGGARDPDLPVLDRKKRDEVRALLWKSFGQEPPDAAPPPTKAAYVLPEVPPWPDGPSDAGPGIEPKYIQQQVRNEFFPLARKCYADLAEHVPDAGGTINLAFDIVGNKNIGGIVEQVDVLNKSTLRDPEFVDCMRQSFLSVTFPPPEGGGMVTVEYPITFEPDDGSDD